MSAMVAYRDRHHSLAVALESASPQMLQLLPAGLPPARIIRVALMACARNPKLLECTQASLVRVVMMGAELGLEIGGVLGQAFIVPFTNTRRGVMEAQFIAGYKGLIKLALQSPRIESVDPQLVHERDQFDYEQGTTPWIKHKPAAGELTSRGEVTHAYAIAQYTSGRSQFAVMARDELEEIKGKSKSLKMPGSPWRTATLGMFRKCPIRRLANYIDVSAGLSKALEYDAEEIHESAARHMPEALGGRRTAELKATLGERVAKDLSEDVLDEARDIEPLEVDEETGHVR